MKSAVSYAVVAFLVCSGAVLAVHMSTRDPAAAVLSQQKSAGPSEGHIPFVLDLGWRMLKREGQSAGTRTVDFEIGGMTLIAVLHPCQYPRIDRQGGQVAVTHVSIPNQPSRYVVTCGVHQNAERPLP